MQALAPKYKRSQSFWTGLLMMSQRTGNTNRKSMSCIIDFSSFLSFVFIFSHMHWRNIDNNSVTRRAVEYDDRYGGYSNITKHNSIEQKEKYLYTNAVQILSRPIYCTPLLF